MYSDVLREGRNLKECEKRKLKHFKINQKDTAYICKCTCSSLLLVTTTALFIPYFLQIILHSRIVKLRLG